MKLANPTTPRAFAVWWKDLDRWVIPSSLLLRRTLPAGSTRVRIATLVHQVTTRIKTKAESEYKMAGVKWYGEGVFIAKQFEAMDERQPSHSAGSRYSDLQQAVCVQSVIRRRAP